MRKNRVLALVVLLAASVAALPVGADTPRKFYKEKQKATSPEAYARAVVHLRKVKVGMSEPAFFETMELAVLAHEGVPKDAMLQGFLPEATRRANAGRDAERRALLFGYVDHGREVVRSRVVIRKHRVDEVNIESMAASGSGARAPITAADGSTAVPADDSE